MRQLIIKVASELCQEFGILAERRDAFDRVIAEFESTWETEEELSEPIGPDRLRRIRTEVRQLQGILDRVHQGALAPSPVDQFLAWHTPRLPMTADGTLDLRELYLECELPEPAVLGPGHAHDAQREAAAIVQQHCSALACYALTRRMRYLSAILDFAPDNDPKRRGRPANGARSLLLRLVLERHQTFLVVPVSYADGQPFVRFCERLLEAYGIETGDTAQLIKRALGRGRRATRHVSAADHDDDLDPYG